MMFQFDEPEDMRRHQFFELSEDATAVNIRDALLKAAGNNENSLTVKRAALAWLVELAEVHNQSDFKENPLNILQMKITIQIIDKLPAYRSKKATLEERAQMKKFSNPATTSTSTQPIVTKRSFLVKHCRDQLEKMLIKQYANTPTQKNISAAVKTFTEAAIKAGADVETLTYQLCAAVYGVKAGGGLTIPKTLTSLINDELMPLINTSLHGKRDETISLPVEVNLADFNIRISLYLPVDADRPPTLNCHVYKLTGGTNNLGRAASIAVKDITELQSLAQALNELFGDGNAVIKVPPDYVFSIVEISVPNQLSPKIFKQVISYYIEMLRPYVAKLNLSENFSEYSRDLCTHKFFMHHVKKLFSPFQFPGSKQFIPPRVQAKRILRLLREESSTHPERKFALTYSANEDQAQHIRRVQAAGGFLENCDFNGANQAAVFAEMIWLLQSDPSYFSLLRKIHVLPVSTMTAGFGALSNSITQAEAIRDLRYISAHVAEADYQVYYLNTEPHTNKPAIGGGVSMFWLKNKDTGKYFISTLEMLSQHGTEGVADELRSSLAFEVKKQKTINMLTPQQSTSAVSLFPTKKVDDGLRKVLLRKLYTATTDVDVKQLLADEQDVLENDASYIGNSSEQYKQTIKICCRSLGIAVASRAVPAAPEVDAGQQPDDAAAESALSAIKK